MRISTTTITRFRVSSTNSAVSLLVSDLSLEKNAEPRSAPFNNVTYQGQAEFVANLTTYTFNEDTNGGEFTNPQIVRLGVGEDEGIVRCDGEDCDAGDYFAFEVCESKNGTGQYG